MVALGGSLGFQGGGVFPFWLVGGPLLLEAVGRPEAEGWEGRIAQYVESTDSIAGVQGRPGTVCVRDGVDEAEGRRGILCAGARGTKREEKESRSRLEFEVPVGK